MPRRLTLANQAKPSPAERRKLIFRSVISFRLERFSDKLKSPNLVVIIWNPANINWFRSGLIYNVMLVTEILE